VNSTHDIDRLEAVIAHARVHELAGTINSVGTFRNIDTSVYLDDHADFIAWARSTGATNVSRGQFDDLAYGYLCDGTPVTVRTRKPRRPEGAVAFTLDEYAAGGGVR